MKNALAGILALGFLSSVLLDKAYGALSVKELKKRARGTGDKRTARLYRLAAYGDSLKVFLWLVGGSSAAGLIYMATDYAWWLALVVTLVLLWLVWLGRPLTRTDGLAWRAASLLAPPVAVLVEVLQPLLKRLSYLSRGLGRVRSHTGLYDKDDLLEFIDSQSRQVDNRMSDQDLKIVKGALTFGDKSVSSVMTPKSKVKMVIASDAIGPHLMDELHASGLGRFPVAKSNVKASEKEIVGTLYLNDLIGHPEGGRVRDVMKKPVYFINESQNLRQALAALIKSQTHLLVVVNNFEEYVGILTIEDVIEQVLGQKITDDFEGYDDKRLVAAVENKSEHDKHSTAEVVE